MTCQNCKIAQKNPNRIDGLDRELVCPILQNLLSLWFAPQVPDYFECNMFQPKEPESQQTIDQKMKYAP